MGCYDKGLWNEKSKMEPLVDRLFPRTITLPAVPNRRLQEISAREGCSAQTGGWLVNWERATYIWPSGTVNCFGAESVTHASSQTLVHIHTRQIWADKHRKAVNHCIKVIKLILKIEKLYGICTMLLQQFGIKVFALNKPKSRLNFYPKLRTEVLKDLYLLAISIS